MAYYNISYIYVWSERAYLRWSVVRDKLPKVKKIVNILIEIVTIILAGLVMIFGGFTISKMNLLQIDSILNIPTGIIYSIIPICGVIIVFYSIYNIMLELKKEA